MGQDSSEGNDAISHLSRLLVSKPDVPGEPPEQRLYHLIYWLRVAAKNDWSPASALDAAGQREKYLVPYACHQQLLCDWHMASVSGLFADQSLACLRDGTAPVAVEGRYVGRRITVVKINLRGPDSDLGNLAFCPEGVPLAADVRAEAVWVPKGISGTLVSARVSQSAMPSFFPNRGMAPPPAPVAPMAGNMRVSGSVNNPGEIRPEQVELHDVPFNGSLPIGGTRKLAVASDNGGVLSVSIIGDGPKVWKPAYNEPRGGDYYATVHNSKVPKAMPIQLPGVTGNAYLIHSEGNARYYFVDTIVNNGTDFRIAKVVGGR